MAKIYVASSWRNQYQQEVIKVLRSLGHKVYDFRNPPGRAGFQWSKVDSNWQNWTTEQYREALNHPVAIDGFNSDFNAMQWADICVMVLPCGRSANTEAGWMAGAGKRVFVYSPEKQEPELMYKIYDLVSDSLFQINDEINKKKVSTMKAEDLIKKNAYTEFPNSPEVVTVKDALTAVELARDGMKEKAIDAFKENCQYPKDAKGCECKRCVRYVGGHCELLEGFIEKLNREE